MCCIPSRIKKQVWARASLSLSHPCHTDFTKTLTKGHLTLFNHLVPSKKVSRMSKTSPEKLQFPKPCKKNDIEVNQIGKTNPLIP